MSPESKKSSTREEEKSLEYKKICYLLETTEKKPCENIEVSQFGEGDSMCSAHTRSRSHSQLGQMITWL